VNLDQLTIDHARYVEARESYKRAALSVAEIVEGIAASVGISAEVHGREKSPAEFVKKAVRKQDKGYLDDPWGMITDKAGARAVVDLMSQVDALRDAITADGSLAIIRTEDGREGRPQQLEYRGLHLQVVVPPGSDDAEPVECELQIRTRAQDLWSSVVSHRFLYKPPVNMPPEVQRSLYRLVSLVELFDGEVGRAMEIIRGLPGFDVSELLDLAERQFLSLVVHPEFDRGLSMQVLEVLSASIDEGEVPTYTRRLEEFTESRREDLLHVLSQYGPGSGTEESRYALLSQPESIVLLERLSNAPDAVAAAWRAAEFPEELLEATSAIWAEPV
jgi:ppGpp synthetase/RelA/SpoT-type nucleotidyltranferase